jgi:ankyrin repeat protein
VVGLLLKRNDVDPNAIGDHVNSLTPLMIAIQNGHEEIVRLLLGKDNVDSNFPNGRGQTPLWWAAWKGHSAGMLPSNGAHSEITTYFGFQKENKDGQPE